jgi:L-iditol 2-dehydrogenase
MHHAPPPGRAARLHGRRDLRVEDAAAPRPALDEVVVRVRGVGLCGSDLHWYEEGAIGETGLVDPLVLGHEIAGVIEGGPRDGERVAVDPANPCERCDLCLSGNGRLCRDMRFAGLAPVDGGLQTAIAWPARRCAPIPGSIADHEAPLLEVLGIAVHALDLAGIRVDESSPAGPASGVASSAAKRDRPLSVGVYGAGPIGLVLIRALRAAGVRDITATDRLSHRVEAAASSGATRALLVPEGVPDPAAAVPVDLAFECAGTDAALDTAVRATMPGGRVLIVGIPAGDTSTYPASAARRKELALQLVRRMEAPDLARAIALVADGRVSLAGLVSHRFALEEAPAAFEVLAERAGLKVVVEPR